MNAELSQQIIEAAGIDQEVRFLGDKAPDIHKYLVYLTDAAHSHRIRTWIQDFGYPI